MCHCPETTPLSTRISALNPCDLLLAHGSLGAISYEPRAKSYIMETIAVYWEETIRTYGIQVEKNLCWVQADILPPTVDAMGQLLAELGEDGTKPRLILAHQFEAEHLRISMVFQEKIKKQLVQFTTRPAVEDVSSALVINCPVEMLYFHGPHFGDRYGIADMAVTALKEKNIRYMAMGCSAASVHLVFPENVGDRAKKALGSVFNTP